MEPARPPSCPVCGQASSTGARFCRRCGARLRTRPVVRDEAEPELPEERQE